MGLAALNFLFSAAPVRPALQGEKKPDFSLTAEEFTREFLKDEKAADKKYKDKVIRLTGEVLGVYSNDGVSP